MSVGGVVPMIDGIGVGWAFTVSKYTVVIIFRVGRLLTRTSYIFIHGSGNSGLADSEM
jgi:hypothetical protein